MNKKTLFESISIALIGTFFYGLILKDQLLFSWLYVILGFVVIFTVFLLYIPWSNKRGDRFAEWMCKRFNTH